MTRRLCRSHARLVAAALAAVVLVACSASKDPGPSGAPTTTPPGAASGGGISTSAPGGDGDPAGADTTVTTASATALVPLASFGDVTITVVHPDGTREELCLWLADTDRLRSQGLMLVEDPALGGRPGMLFRFDNDVTGSFWMRNTRLPLTIVYVDADGRPVSTTDMAPCPDTAEDCPSYPADGPYRYAIEVPQGQLDELGIDHDVTIDVAEGCA